MAETEALAWVGANVSATEFSEFGTESVYRYTVGLKAGERVPWLVARALREASVLQARFTWSRYVRAVEPSYGG